MIANVSYRGWKKHTRRAVIQKGHQIYIFFYTEDGRNILEGPLYERAIKYIFFSIQKLIREGRLKEAS